MSNTTTSTNNNNDIKKQSDQCPYAPRQGYATADAYKEYARDHKELVPVDVSNEYALTGSTNDNEPLYFWQLYSVIGEEPIIKLVTDFYKRVFADKETPWFRDAFVRLAPLDHHIATQSAYWIDAMGGGRLYHGGNYRLHFHHSHNTQSVMTAAGAKRWMYHMRGALEGAKFFDDPRVKPAILDFLTTKMRTYAQEFGWEFDESDMELYQDS